MNTVSIRDKVIDDFGDQWSRYPEGGGYFDSDDFLRDVVEPLLSVDDFRGAEVAEIGSGQGRIVSSLARLGAAKILALEPSRAMKVLRNNTRQYADRITYVRAPGDQLPPLGFDIMLSIGVVHHIPEPEPVLRAAYRALKPGGRLFLWLYGREGNELYLAIAGPLRRLTSLVPDPLLGVICHPLAWGLSAYALLCRRLPLPMRNYMRRVISPLGMRHRRLVIFDQLHPAWAKYYTRDEAIALLENAGFVDVRTFHRHGYSWSVLGVRPAESSNAQIFVADAHRPWDERQQANEMESARSANLDPPKLAIDSSVDAAARASRPRSILLFVALVFVSYQLYLSAAIWSHSGNVPPGFDDSYSYIFDIRKVAEYESLLPRTAYPPRYSHLKDLSYNQVMASFWCLLGVAPSKVFEASFFVGKLVLVALLLRLLLALEADGLVVASMLAALAPSSGTPELHGFYWVVPSFWPASSYAPATSPQLRRSSSLWPPRPTT